MATEDVYGASPEYWSRDGNDWKQKSVEELIADEVVQRCLAKAKKDHGRRLVSVNLHLDEETPHLHVVAVPLVWRDHAARGPKPAGSFEVVPGDLNHPDKKKRNDWKRDLRPSVGRWTLDVSTARTLSALEDNHTAWALDCSDLGLNRGSKGSDMTREQRKARDTRQTGKASKAEKTARILREELQKEAEETLIAAKAEAARLIENSRIRGLCLISDGGDVKREAKEEATAIREKAEVDAKATREAAEADAKQIRQIALQGQANVVAQSARDAQETTRLNAVAKREKEVDEAAAKVTLAAAEIAADELTAAARTESQKIQQDAKVEASQAKSAAADAANRVRGDALRSLEAREAHIGGRNTEADREEAQGGPRGA